MITKEFRKRFKSSLGVTYNYTPEVKKILQELSVTNRDGNPYSSQSIRNVFNGKRENEAIEFALLQCYKKEVQLKDKIKHLKSSINEEDPSWTWKEE